MTSRLFFVALLGLFTAGCDLMTPAAGSWELEVEDAERCYIDMDLDQEADELDGDADVFCRLYFTYGDELYYYDLDHRSVSVTGDYDQGDVELELSFYDDFYETTIEIEIEGELEDGEFEGEMILGGSYFGDLAGDVRP